MKKKSPYMPLYGKDAWSDEKFAALPWDVQGLFWRLAYWQWIEGSIPNDVEVIASIVGKPRETRRIWGKYLNLFFVPLAEDSSRLINIRLERHRAEMIERQGKNRNGAELTNNKRWRSHSDSQSDSPSDEIATPFFIASRVANENAVVSTVSPEGEREGKPKTSYGQFLFLATKVAEWLGQTDGLYTGSQEAFEAAFERKFSISYRDFEALRDSFKGKASA